MKADSKHFGPHRDALAELTVEFAGTPWLCQVQEELYLRRELLASLPNSFSQGRTLGLMHVRPTQLIPRVLLAGIPSRLLVHLLCEDVVSSVAALKTIGYKCDPAYDLLAGRASNVVRCTTDLLPRLPSPIPLRLAVLCETSSVDQIRALQKLQAELGLTPVPGWVLRGTDSVTRTFVLLDTADCVQGGVSIQLIPYRRSIGAMGFGLCIEPSYARRGYAKRLNATAMMDANTRGARWMMEVVAPGASSSKHVNATCGLTTQLGECFLFAKFDANSIN